MKLFDKVKKWMDEKALHYDSAEELADAAANEFHLFNHDGDEIFSWAVDMAKKAMHQASYNEVWYDNDDLDDLVSNETNESEYDLYEHNFDKVG